MMAGLVDDAEQVMSSGAGAVRAWPVVVWLVAACVACGEAADDADGGRAADAVVVDARLVEGEVGVGDQGMDGGEPDRGAGGTDGGQADRGDDAALDSGEVRVDGEVTDGTPADGMAADGTADGMIPDGEVSDEGVALDEGPTPDEGAELDMGPEPDMAPPPDMGPECRVAQDCAAGLVCIDGACMPCVDDMQCAGVCVEGRCAACDPADHRGCADDTLCCDADGGGEACVPTSVASGCEACGVACDPAGADGCANRLCTCQGEAACDGALFCQPPEAALRCVACRDDADCVDPVRPRCDGATGQCALPLDLFDVLASRRAFRTFVLFVRDAGLEDDLRGRASLTVFAPTDDAFLTLPDACIIAMQFEPALLETFVRQHIGLGIGRVDSASMRLNAEAGAEIPVETFDSVLASIGDDGEVLLDGIPLVEPAVEAQNGVAHRLVEGVLLNDELEMAGCE